MLEEIIIYLKEADSMYVCNRVISDITIIHDLPMKIVYDSYITNDDF